MKKVLLTGLAVLIPGIGGIAAFNRIVSRREVQLQQEWSLLDPGPEDFVRRFPKSGPNAAALELERRGAAIGVDMATGEMKGRSRPIDADATEFRSVGDQLRDWLDAELTRDNDLIGSAPESVARFLRQHSAALSAIQDALLSGGPPRWETDLGKTWEAPIPNLLGHLRMQRLLMARALGEIRSKQPDAAWRTFEASRRLSDGIRDRPEEMTRLILFAVVKLQAGFLRKTQAPPADWQGLLDPTDYRRSYWTTLHLEAWSFHERMKEMSRGNLLAIERLWGTEYSRNLERVTADLRKQDPCGLSARVAERIWDRPFSRMNVLGRIAWHTRDIGYRLFRLEIDLEGTEKILAAKEARRRAPDQKWPRELSGLESAVCPGRRWAYRVNENGTATISFDASFDDWPKPKVMRLPMTFTAGATASAPIVLDSGRLRT